MLILCFEVEKARVLQFPAKNLSPWMPGHRTHVKTFGGEKIEKELQWQEKPNIYILIAV
jgi:hypothetical protein